MSGSRWISVAWFLFGWALVFSFSFVFLACGPNSPSVSKTQLLQQQYQYSFCGLVQRTNVSVCAFRLSNSPYSYCLTTAAQRISDYFSGFQLNESRHLCVYGNHPPFPSMAGAGLEEFRVEEFIEQ